MAAPLILKITLRPMLCRLLLLFACASIISSVAQAAGFEDLSQALNGALGSSPEQEFLPPDQAFRLDARIESGVLLASWTIVEGYYLYRDKISFALPGTDYQLIPAPFPPGDFKDDEHFGRMEVYHHDMQVRVPLPASLSLGQPIRFDIGYQGCAEAGICYAPIKKTFTLTPTAKAVTPAVDAMSTAGTGEVLPPASGTSESDRLAALLTQQPLWLSLAIFFGLGLGLAFTPCVFPMIPILSGLIAGQGTCSTRHAFMLSGVYVMAMAFANTLAGVVAGLFGASVQSALQDPRVLVAFAALFVILALSMFGLYKLQLPAAVQTRIAGYGQGRGGGKWLGVAVMGLLSALIVGPCVAAPLAGALLVIAQSGDAVLGGAALFSLSLGMGVPLLVFGTTLGRVLPKSGPWLNAVNAVFGVLLLAVAIALLERVLPQTLTLGLWGLLLVSSGVYLGAFDTRDGRSGWGKLCKSVGVASAVWGAFALYGAASGGGTVLAPLARSMAYTSAGSVAAAPAFRTVKNLDALQAGLMAARRQGRPVLVDFYADWCVSCKELEHKTFADAKVREVLDSATLLRADVTANDAGNRSLLQHYGLIGPPAVLFFDVAGHEQRAQRIIGYVDAGAFLVQAGNAWRK